MGWMKKAMALALLSLAMWATPAHGQVANAVVLEEGNKVDIANDVAFSFAKRRTVLIRNANGAHHADFSIYMGNDMSLDGFQFTLSDTSRPSMKVLMLSAVMAALVRVSALSAS